MNRIVYRTTLDLHEPIEGLVYDVTQNDSATEFVFAFREDRKAYHITDGTEVVFRAVKPDGTVLYNNCVVADDTATYKLTSQTSAVIGIVECELTIYSNNGEQLTSPRFAIRVHENLYSDSEVESEDEFTELQTAIAALENLDVEVSRSGDTTTITITRKDGTQETADIRDGTDGADGTNGNGVFTTTNFLNEQAEIVMIDDIVLPSGRDLMVNDILVSTGNFGVARVSFIDNVAHVEYLGSIKGANGADGAPGADGEDGEDGADGVSVVSLSINAQNHLIVTLSNGQTSDAGVVPSGTSDHSSLSNRDVADQHPVSAITGLTSALGDKQNVISDLADIRAGAKLFIINITGNNPLTSDKTFSQITTAISNGYVCICLYNGNAYTKAYVGASGYGFSNTYTSGEVETTTTISIGDDDEVTISTSYGGGTSDYEELDNLPQIEGVELIGNKTFSDLGLEQEQATEIEVPLYTVTSAESATATLKNYDTTVLPGTPTAVAVTLPTPSAGNDYLVGLIFKAGASMTFSDTAPTGYAIKWDSNPTWTSGKVYEIIYRCLWLTDGNGDVVISAKWSEV